MAGPQPGRSDPAAMIEDRFHPVHAVRIGDDLFAVDVRVDAPLVMDPDVLVELHDSGTGATGRVRLRDQAHVGWLPRGHYRFAVSIPGIPADATLEAAVTCGWRARGQPTWATGPARLPVQADDAACSTRVVGVTAGAGTTPVDSLSWNGSHGAWFHRHFDHAARTAASYLLKDHPSLQGRILDVGCGDGITDLGLALYCEPELLVGIDPFGGFSRLAEVAERNHVPRDAIPDCLKFMKEDANALPFEDDSFDVVVSWGSLEHIAGGHGKAMREIKRVLRDGGLFFAHPGLYYSAYGHHLGEFCADPHFHLKYPQDEVKRIVFETPPSRIDRSGHVATPAEYWQWYQELNPITVDSFERELRELGFEPWRVAIRTEPIIEYTREILHYPMQTLATGELYVSAWNRKPRT